jgi:putative flippase GtrA
LEYIKKKLDNQIIRYIIIGLSNTIIGYLFFALLIYLKIHYALACSISTVFSIVFNFKTTALIVFKNKNNLLIFRYLILWSVVYLFNLIGLSILNGFKINNYLSGIILLFPSALIGFTFNKFFVFKKKGKTDYE